jgi:cytochrome c553
MNKIFTAAVLVLASAASYSAIAGGNIEAGKDAVSKRGCVGCHGTDLNTPVNGDTPKLAGQYKDYVVHALTAYRRGAESATANGRANPTMGGMASQLSDKEIKDIAAYVSSLPGSLVLDPESKFLHHAAAN